MKKVALHQRSAAFDRLRLRRFLVASALGRKTLFMLSWSWFGRLTMRIRPHPELVEGSKHGP